MKRIVLLLAVMSLMLSGMALARTLSDEEQQSLVDRMRAIYDNAPEAVKIAAQEHQKCATDIAYEYFINRDNLSGEYATSAAKIADRPDLPFYYDSPGGHFKIHYTLSGTDALYFTQDEDTDGVPDYVNEIADMCDSAWNEEVVNLGFDAPPSDGTAGGDSRVDIYIRGLSSAYYGVTWADQILNSQSATTYVELDNDYNIYPYSQSSEMSRRLEAAAVTIAHEFFHTIHFGMDYTESEDQLGYQRLPWWEMSAVWMEDVVFTTVNDYIYYQSALFEYPWVGLKTATPTLGQHQYAVATWPMYLSEKFGDDIIRDIWTRCRDYGIGMQFITATDDAIKEYSGYDTTSDSSQYINDTLIVKVHDLKSAFAEYSMWLYFTGSRATDAPADFGFNEASLMYWLPDTVMATVYNYERADFSCPRNDTLLNGTDIHYQYLHPPQNLGSEYYELENISFLQTDSFVIQPLNVRTNWSYSITEIPVSAAADPIVSLYTTNTDFQQITHTVQDPSQVSKIVMASSPTYAANDSSYNKSYCVLVFFESDSIDVIEGGNYAIKAPYPNPKTFAGSDDNYINFEASFADLQAPGKDTQLFVTIYTPAGEKVIELESDKERHFENYPINIQWDMKNSIEGSDIAPGVYLAMCELVFFDGTDPLIEKYKIAVIK